VTLLFLVFVGVAVYAWQDMKSRHERNAWERTLSIAVVLVRVTPLEPDAVGAFRDRVPALDARLFAELRRYRPRGPRPFALTFVGPVDLPAGPPSPGGEGLVDAVKRSWALSRWADQVDAATGLDARTFDSRIYVVARAPKAANLAMVEGESEEGGRIGAVEVELKASMADFALFVTAHELMHTLGASDKYDSSGRAVFPGGFAEPERAPLFPQELAEVMARNRPLSADEERPPDTLNELAVGAATAREIGWTL
jgi:hypothetical protein